MLFKSVLFKGQLQNKKPTKQKTDHFVYLSSWIKLFKSYMHLKFIYTINISSTQNNPEIKINTQIHSLLPSRNSLQESSEDESKSKQL